MNAICASRFANRSTPPPPTPSLRATHEPGHPSSEAARVTPASAPSLAGERAAIARPRLIPVVLVVVLEVVEEGGGRMVRIASALGLVMFSVALLILSLISYVSIKKDFLLSTPRYGLGGGSRMSMFHTGFR